MIWSCAARRRKVRRTCVRVRESTVLMYTSLPTPDSLCKSTGQRSKTKHRSSLFSVTKVVLPWHSIQSRLQVWSITIPLAYRCALGMDRLEGVQNVAGPRGFRPPPPTLARSRRRRWQSCKYALYNHNHAIKHRINAPSYIWTFPIIKILLVEL